MAENKIVVAFDLYGTLLSTDSIVDTKAQSISTSWRRYQLEYTRRLNSMGRYDSFSNITRNSLRHAVAEHGEKLDEDAIDELLRAYDSLSTFPDVLSTLRQLADRPDITAVVFSNGTQDMVTNSVRHSPDLPPHSAVFGEIITVDEVRQFKPASAVYAHLAEKLAKSPSSQMADLWLVSGNPFDVLGARSCGMQAIWVDRGRRGWMDAAVPDLQPTAVVHDLNDILTVIR
ncbi:haloacid dehalogenase, type II [Aspergillus novofumigatus IBT 16806]|uniref:Haloacid dehalogenase, type II n=1 Tax=Aspergillus novofumigatus (strain IBT 16806) TaxID=1392255 RepID=A0A2I1CJK7_ASPN1|nr:haloacid dehalogenase, type II [Aspergillus novofumigatus IBT 16806]PKX97797.1 haloacid dehalogenase, type II [Aspergillus novofumigatus IBT 16806]